jgi:hypothetical protein
MQLLLVSMQELQDKNKILLLWEVAQVNFNKEYEQLPLEVGLDKIIKQVQQLLLVTLQVKFFKDNMVLLLDFKRVKIHKDNKRLLLETVLDKVINNFLQSQLV